ncbi:MAG: ParB N-terminal domain-containing protein [Amylibacter sp.]|nr:ParB N-terminal domain-containing protein [Amylibacter sp.]
MTDIIETFGFTNPVSIDEHRSILAGHGRVEGAKLLGKTEVPCAVKKHDGRSKTSLCPCR